MASIPSTRARFLRRADRAQRGGAPGHNGGAREGVERRRDGGHRELGLGVSRERERERKLGRRRGDEDGSSRSWASSTRPGTAAACIFSPGSTASPATRRCAPACVVMALTGGTGLSAAQGRWAAAAGLLGLRAVAACVIQGRGAGLRPS
jgi:hypothetical protein